MGVHLYTNGAWTDSGRIYRNSINLFTTENSSPNCYINPSGLVNPITGWIVSDYIMLSGNQTYTINFNSTAGAGAYFAFYDDSKILISTINSENTSFTTPSNTHYARFSYRDASFDIILNTGSAALPYEPYNVVDWYTNTGHGYTSGAWT